METIALQQIWNLKLRSAVRDKRGLNQIHQGSFHVHRRHCNCYADIDRLNSTWVDSPGLNIRAAAAARRHPIQLENYFRHRRPSRLEYSRRYKNIWSRHFSRRVMNGPSFDLRLPRDRLHCRIFHRWSGLLWCTARLMDIWSSFSSCIIGITRLIDRCICDASVSSDSWDTPSIFGDGSGEKFFWK